MKPLVVLCRRMLCSAQRRVVALPSVVLVPMLRSVLLDGGLDLFQAFYSLTLAAPEGIPIDLDGIDEDTLGRRSDERVVLVVECISGTTTCAESSTSLCSERRMRKSCLVSFVTIFSARV